MTPIFADTSILDLWSTAVFKDMTFLKILIIRFVDEIYFGKALALHDIGNHKRIFRNVQKNVAE